MTNINRFAGLKHTFIFQQSSAINPKVQKHKRYVVVNYAVLPSNLAKNLYSITTYNLKENQLNVFLYYYSCNRLQQQPYCAQTKKV